MLQFHTTYCNENEMYPKPYNDKCHRTSASCYYFTAELNKPLIKD